MKCNLMNHMRLRFICYVAAAVGRLILRGEWGGRGGGQRRGNSMFSHCTTWPLISGIQYKMLYMWWLCVTVNAFEKSLEHFGWIKLNLSHNEEGGNQILISNPNSWDLSERILCTFNQSVAPTLICWLDQNWYTIECYVGLVIILKHESISM